MKGKIRPRTGEHAGLGLDPAPAGEVDDLGIASEDDTPAGLANLCAVVEVVARTECPPLKLLRDLAAHHEAGSACPFAVLEPVDVVVADHAREEAGGQATQEEKAVDQRPRGR